jgi:hypothetical protein
MANNGAESGTVQRGQVIGLTQRCTRRREYGIRAGDRALGWLQWRQGRRSIAQAEGRGIGLIELTTSRRRVTVAGLSDAETLATVDRQRGGSIIHVIDGHALRWEKTARGNRWAIVEQGDALLSVIASQGLLRSSVRIVAERTMPEETAVLLCLIGGYLALSELQSMVDTSAAIGGIVAAAGG